MTLFFKAFFTDVIRNDDYKFRNNSSLRIASVLIGATRDLTVSNLTVTFPDLQDQRNKPKSPQKPKKLSSLHLENSAIPSKQSNRPHSNSQIYD